MNTMAKISEVAAMSLMLFMALPSFAQNEAAPVQVGPSQQEIASLMEMARQMMGVLPQMMKTLEALEKEFDRIDMESKASLDLTEPQKSQVMRIQKDYWESQAELAVKEKEESFKLQELLSTERPDSALVAEQQMHVDDIRRQMLVSRINARNQLYDALNEKQRQQLRRNEPTWLKGTYPSQPTSGTTGSLEFALCTK